MAQENNKQHIHFHLLSTFSLRERNLLRMNLIKLFQREQKKLSSLNYIFCDDKYLLQINQQFLQHDDLTDIITFDLSQEPSMVTGEIYISIERVRENAGIFRVSFQEELRRVIFHGALHLCGYKDKTPKAKKEMRKKEDEYLARYRSTKNSFGAKQ